MRFGKRSIGVCVTFGALTCFAPAPVLAGGHTWRINELFSNASGTVQFIELAECCGGPAEVGTAGHAVTSNTNSFTIPANRSGSTSFKKILLGTAAFAALPGAPPLDYTISANFFSTSGDTMRYVPYDTFTFGAGALPTDGINSIQVTNYTTHTFTTGPNTPTNYAGQSGSVNAGTCTVDGDCNDGVACTTNTCPSGSCVYTPNNANCPSDGMFCNGTEFCDATLGCRSPGNPCTTPPNLFCNEVADICGTCGSDGDCNDGVACTTNTCTNGACVYTPNNANCAQNGAFCDGPEICHATNNCVSSGDPCGAGQACNETTDACDTTAIGIGLEVVAGGSAATAGGPPLSSPLAVTHAGDGRLFVVDQIGLIRVIDAGGTLLPTPFLDLTSKLPTLNGFFDERGFLGLAFHPEYLINGKFYVRYSAPRASTGSEPCDLDTFINGCHMEVLAQYSVLGDPATSNVADDTSEIILFTADKPQWNHNSGHVAFGPDGYLYWTLGDGGGANDGLTDSPPSHGPNGNGQNIDSPLGKMLRIDVNTGSPYSIPADNPFVGVAGLDEIYAYGFRNPYKFSFDLFSGDLYVGDVGQDAYEEVDLVELGGNYGWVIREGFECFDPVNTQTPPASCATTGALGEPLRDPLSAYLHPIPCTMDSQCAPLGVGCDEIRGLCEDEGGLAVVGGYVYRGMEFPDLVGMYVYGDFSADFGPTGRLYYFPTTGPNAYERVEFYYGGGGSLDKVLKGFGEDDVGELYVCASDDLAPAGGSGIIYRIVPLPSTPQADPGGVSKNRTLSISAPPAAVAGPTVQTAIKVTMIDLQHAVPANAPASVTRRCSASLDLCIGTGQGNCPSGQTCDLYNYITFDTRVNGVCVGGSHNGHHCDIDADCRVCTSGPGATLHRVCASNADCGGGAGSCPAGGTCSGLAGCTNPDEANDCARWVGEPHTFLESQDIPGIGTLRAARLQCTPYYHDWGSEGLVHVFGGEIAPSSTYEVRNYSGDCIDNEETCTLVSQPLTMKTGRYGDVVATFNPPGTTQQPDGSDVNRLVDKFRNQPGAPGKAISLIQPNLPELNGDVSGSDITRCVDAFRQIEYRFLGPCPCPSLADCGALACPSSASVCTQSNLPGLGRDATCIRTCTGGDNDGDPCVNNSHCPGGGTCGNPFCRDRCGRCD